MRSSRSVLLPALAALSIIVAACTSTSPSESSGPSGSSAPASGGTVRVGIGGFPDSLNPGNGLLSESYTLYELVYDTPIGLTPDGDYVPELAKSWSVSDDGLTWSVELVDNATFHDGTALTAEDLKFSLELYRDTVDFPYMPAYPDVFETIEAVDATHLTITTAEPIGNFESRMVFIYVIPKHIWESVDDPVAFQNEEMIGSGPFKFVESEQGQFTRLAANKDYWGDAPKIDEVIFQTYDNADARVAALVNGDIDMITEFPNTAVATLRNAENVEVVVADPVSGDLRDIIPNIVDPENCPVDEGGVCTGHPALLDVQVRKALAMAMDKQQIIDVALLSLGSPGLSMVPRGLGDFFADDVSDYAFDVSGANDLLDTAGYADTNGDGIRECLPSQDCPTGDLTFRFNFPDDIDSGPREADMLKAMWQEIGVKIEIQALDADTLTSICCPTFDFDLILWGWGSDPDPAFLLGVALCDEIPTGFSETGYCNPDYDELYVRQGVEPDHQARVAIVHEMQQILVDDVVYMIPYYASSTQAYRSDRFTGWVTGPTTIGLEDPSSLGVISKVQ
ncbi:MAG: ABC transporter substrate-binding protein [Chloroflexota bacterium]|nr:ABC transporter substrate-binding protein [Chloroflexota bacterium]